jgi:hypothetical protein
LKRIGSARAAADGQSVRRHYEALSVLVIAMIALVEHLAGLQAPYSITTWDTWLIQPVPSGNNLLFRATG